MTRLRSPFTLSLIALCLGLATIAGALAFQYLGGYEPCELCYQQRWPYYLGLPVLALTVLFWERSPKSARIAGPAITAAIFAWGAWMGGFHAGVEWGFWPGPTSCTGLGNQITMESLQDLDQTRIVPCDEVQWRFAGLSFAGWNALISLILAALLAAAVWRVVRTDRQEA